MPTMTFRFTTECEMTLKGDSYEDVYLRFKDFMHGELAVQNQAQLKVYPPESDQMFFHMGEEDDFHEIPRFKGGFSDDIVRHCEGHPLTPGPVTTRAMLSQKVKGFIPDFYW